MAAPAEAGSSRVAATAAQVVATEWAIAKFPADRAGEILAPSVVLPEVGIKQEPAVREAAPAWGVVEAAEAAVGDGDK